MDNSSKNKSANLYGEELWLKACVEGILFVSEGIVKARDISSALEITEKKVYGIINLRKRNI